MVLEITTNVLKDILGAADRITISGRDSIKLRELFDHLSDVYGKELLPRLLYDGFLRPEIIFLINGESLDSVNGLERELINGDRLAILTAMAGG